MGMAPITEHNSRPEMHIAVPATIMRLFARAMEPVAHVIPHVAWLILLWAV